MWSMWSRSHLVARLCALVVVLVPASVFATGGRLPQAAAKALEARIRLDLGHQGKIQVRRSALSKDLKSSSWMRTAQGAQQGRAYVVNAKAVNADPWGKRKGSYLVVETVQPNDAVSWEAYPLALHQKANGAIGTSRVATINRGKAGGKTIQAQLFADGALGATKVVGAFVAKNTGEGYGFNQTMTVAERAAAPGAQGAKRKMTLFLLGQPTERGAKIDAALYGGPVPMFTRNLVAPPPGINPPRPPQHPDWTPSFIKASVEQLMWAQTAR